jgi:peptidoglycan/LPS O-acetylase OafA/YrhL
MQVFFGMFLADLSNHAATQQWSSTRPWTRTILSPLLLVLGLFLASYPEDHPEWSSWSSRLRRFATYIMPEGHDIPRYYTAFGLELITLSIHFSPRLKDLLSNRYFLWLGKHSFGVYLLHGTLIRWILTWCLFGMTVQAPVQDDHLEWHPGPNLEMRGPIVGVICIPLWFLLLYSLAHLWTEYVDPLCARWTVAIEKYVWANHEKLQTVSPLPQ